MAALAHALLERQDWRAGMNPAPTGSCQTQGPSVFETEPRSILKIEMRDGSDIALDEN